MKILPLHLLIGESLHQSGNRMLFPLHLPGVVRFNTSPQQLAKQVARAFQDKVLKKGLYDQILSYFSNEDLIQDRLNVKLDASVDQLFPELELPFDIFYFQNEGLQFIGFVPLLSIESVGKTLEELYINLSENIRLEFIRKKRFQSVATLIATQWFSEVKVHRVPVDLTFYTLGELEKMAEAGKQQILPEVAQKMSSDAGTLVGLKKEYDQLASLLSGYLRNSVVVVGNSGKGKTTLIREFVGKRTLHGLGNVAVWEISAAQLLHRLTSLGSWEEYLAYMCNELRTKGDLLYISNLAELFEVGQYVGNSMSFADYLRDYIARGEIILISECTPEQMTQIELKSPGYTALFAQVKIEEMSGPVIQQIVLQKVALESQAKNITVEEIATKEILRLQQWYSPYSGLPGKTIRFLEALLSEKEKYSTVSKSDIYARFCQETGMPEFMINPDIPLDIDAMSQFFYKNIYGQEDAIQTVLDVLISIKAAVIRRGKPLASLLFVGPTGVGKTEMAKVLAEFVFGNRQKMIRFDMSEYADYLSVLRLTGDLYASGEGLLTAAVRREPFSVLLFDELEKVHPSFYDLLLQILGEGRLTDSKGRVADFCSTIIILTSNIGARSYQVGTVGFIETKAQKDTAISHFQNEVQNFFRPELFNRLDRILAFAPLERSVIRHIVDREIAILKKREGINGRNLVIDIAKDILDYLGREGYNWAYGARFLQRTIQDKVVIPLSGHLNTYEFHVPLEISIELKENEPHFRINRRNETQLIEQAVEVNSELTVIEFTNEVTKQRRNAITIRNGSYYAHFISRLDQLNRKLAKLKDKRQEEKFWKDDVQSKVYYELMGIRDDFDSIIQQIQDIESENFLLLNGNEVDSSELYPLFQSWKKMFRSQKLKLVQLENPEFMKCIIGIYGHAGSVMQLTDIYRNLSQERGYTVQAFQIWHNNQEVVFSSDTWQRFRTYNLYADLKKQPLTYLRYSYDKPTDDNFALVGVELEVTGNLPFLFFKSENGRHNVTTVTGEVRKYQVIVSTQPFDKFRTPGGIHRKNFFEGDKPRRHYTPKGLQDTTYELTTSTNQYEQALSKILQEQLDTAIDSYLL
ncbi:AAA family ATPase [Xanthocytophaga agilis]|uniref:AAA family ATPase n=1 Tax=Xanthocytophaga agilis TaxID=3048010 RepID=A0AAE3R310_9BACT|nr:AAA family ATPase [Xanthocytophaga agilis]MDJ1499747.1 AAA family ATPase [Xanthocytophaga agilis]